MSLIPTASQAVQPDATKLEATVDIGSASGLAVTTGVPTDITDSSTVLGVHDPSLKVLGNSDGDEIVTVDNLASTYLGAAIVQHVKTSTQNSSIAALAAGGSFTGTGESTFGVAGIQVNVYCNQPVRVSVEQSIDGAGWYLKDVYVLPAQVADGRTVQATAEYFRVVVTNLGPATTTIFNLQSVLCPTVEALPRTLTTRGLLRLCEQTRSYMPAPQDFTHIGDTPGLHQDVKGQLRTRGFILTDEGSFRDDFNEADIYTDVTGTCNFRNGSDHVIGSGTSFLTELVKDEYLRLSTDPRTDALKIKDAYSDTDCLLETPYGGSTAAGTGRRTAWVNPLGAGGSITQGSSKRNWVSGVTADAITYSTRGGDYLPLRARFLASLDQRITKQEAFVGFMDNEDLALAGNKAIVVFNGEDNTKVTLRTSNATSDTEETTATLPIALTTAAPVDFHLEVTSLEVTLYANGIRVITHTTHIPSPYGVVDNYIGIKNGNVPASPTTLTLDYYCYSSFNSVDTSSAPNKPIITELSTSATGVSTNVAGANADTSLLAANIYRRGATIFNDSTAILYLKLGTGASATSFTVRLLQNDYYELPFNYVGAVNGFWASATGYARVTELT